MIIPDYLRNNKSSLMENDTMRIMIILQWRILCYSLPIDLNFLQQSYQIIFVQAPSFTFLFVQDSVGSPLHTTRYALRIKIEYNANLLTPCKTLTKVIRSKTGCMRSNLRDIFLKSNGTKLVLAVSKNEDVLR